MIIGIVEFMTELFGEYRMAFYFCPQKDEFFCHFINSRKTLVA